jgi:DNA-directed RNA polymerase specialized sigma24 family protein
MGTPVGTVRSRLHYALKYLREALEADARLERNAGTA